jgi:DNA-binding MarR family transcriptional regulator
LFSILTKKLIGELNMAMQKFKMLNLICENCTLTSKEKLVAQYFIYKSNKTGECYPSVETISKHCGVSQRTVQRATKKLQEKNYIFIEKRYYKGRQSSNQYSLNTTMRLENDREIQETNVIESEKKDELEIITLNDILSGNESIEIKVEDENIEDNQDLESNESGYIVDVEINLVTQKKAKKNLLEVTPIKNVMSIREINNAVKYLVYYKIIFAANNFEMLFLLRNNETNYYIIISKVYINQYRILFQLYTYDFFISFLGVTW